jgi:HK97 family phage prohead protease
MALAIRQTPRIEHMDIERRFFDSGRLELRRGKPGAETKSMTIAGYAARFNVLSENLGGFREQIAPGAFADCLSDDVRALFNHDPNMILGRTTAGTCRISQDSQGLQYEVDLPDTQAARDLMVAIERGDISQSSFGFRIAPSGDAWDENADGMLVRTITKMGRLYDVSPVTMPAYPDASVGTRSLQRWKSSKEVEKAAEMARKAAESRALLVVKRRKLTLLR